MKHNDKDMMYLDTVWAYLMQEKRLHILENIFKDEEKSLGLSGLSEGAKLFLTALLAKQSKGLCLLFSDELKLRHYDTQWGEALNVQIFRAREEQRQGVRLFKHSKKQEQERMYVLGQLAQKRPLKVALTTASLLQILPSPAQMQASTYVLSTKKPLDPLVFEKKLLAMGYEKKSKVEAAGEFARRGDVMDVWPVGFQSMLEEARHQQFCAFVSPAYEQHLSPKKQEEAQAVWEALDDQTENLALRFSFFDDEIEQCKLLDTDNQRSLEHYPYEELLLFPAQELRYPEDAEQHQRFVKAVQSLVEDPKHLDQGQHFQKQQKELQEYASYILQAKAEVNLSPFAYLLFETPDSDKPYAHFFDYIQHMRLVVEETSTLEHALKRTESEHLLSLSQAIFKGEVTRLYSHNFLESESVWQDFLKHPDKVYCSLLPLGQKAKALSIQEQLELKTRDLPFYEGQEQQLQSDFIEALEKGTVFVCQVSERIREQLLLWIETANLHSEYKKRLIFLPDFWKQGFECDALQICFFGSDQLERSRKKNRTRKRSKKYTLDLFSGLKTGDYVVHDVHGIARYEGLITLEKDGYKRDYLHLAYQGDASLYIPMEALDQVQKYVSVGADKAPKLSKLGSGDFAKLKERARSSTKVLATNLVQLYAERLKLKGYVFEKDEALEQAFAGGFAYVETDDQEKAMFEIEQDMCSAKCMDRLLCGDVGFGKTEVAFRALFKSVVNGKQAVLIAPTTVLVHQHFLNLSERLKDFPVRVAELSRFVKPKEQRQTLEDLAQGKMDVLVATHRIFSKDVVFKDLGLIVVDEEQRFGVDHKEQLKARYPLVDVLTLSATPIPRTLHMGLAGIRDISLLQEAPVDRRAVMTYVFPFDADVLIEAIQREVARQGQVFYLFNNTHTIYRKAEELKQWLPHLRIGVAHGKMSEQALEQEIQAFLNQDYDLLLCTTIIESGIDMPNVNTLIVEHADRFGLAQLYQLRGRVGRSMRQAYAYLTYEASQVLTEQAQKRLSAISDFTALGSGFKVAMKDLEARGAGNVLGAEQHGQLEAVGYELYCRMLEEEITLAKAVLQEEGEGAVMPPVSIKVQPSLSVQDVLVDLRLDAYIPKQYISDESERMDMYRRIAKIRTEADYQDCLEELIDRYGEPNELLMALLAISYIRVQAAKLGICLIRPLGESVQFLFAKDFELSFEDISLLMEQKPYQAYFQLNVSGARPELIYRKQFARPAQLALHLQALFLAYERAYQKKYMD